MLTIKQLLLTVLAVLFFTATGFSSQAQYGTWDGKLHVVYHLSETDKVNFALNNIRNHLKGGGGAEKLDIILVVHGPALDAFNRADISDRAIDLIGTIQGQGVTLVACGNTMNIKQLETDELIGDFQIAEEGGVTRIANLQSLGYLYIRP